MIYPKIPRKSLALLLICLIFTLAAVGIMFIIYFFNTNNSLFVRPLLKKIYSEGEYHHHQQQLQQQQHQQLQQKEQDQLVEQHPKEQHLPRYEEIEGSFYEPYSGLEMHRKQLKYTGKDKKYYRNAYQHQLHEAGSSNEFSDTIYIDDYDRFNEKIESAKSNRNSPGSSTADDDLLDINGIDYFEAIILDHNPKKSAGQMRGMEKSPPHVLLQDGLSSKERDLLAFTKGLNQRRSRLNRIKGKRYKSGEGSKGKVANGDEEAFDNETTGSGSGDFIDDTEADDEKQTHQKQQQMQLQRHGDRARKHFKPNRRNGGPKEQKLRTFELENSENLYSVSSEIVSNLSNESTHKPATSTLFGGVVTSTTSSMSSMPAMTSSMQPLSSISSLASSTSAEARTNRINKFDKKPPLPLISASSPASYLTSSSSSLLSGSGSSKKWIPPSVVSSREVVTSVINQSPESPQPIEEHQSGAWLETRARRIMGNVKKSEERSRQLLLCEEAGGGELCRMLFKGHLNE